MLQPGVRAKRRILSELHPLVAHRAEDPVRLDVGQERVGAEGGGAVLGASSAGVLGGGDGILRGRIPFIDGMGRGCIRRVTIARTDTRGGRGGRPSGWTGALL